MITSRTRARRGVVIAALVGAASIGAAAFAVVLARLGEGGGSTFDSFSWALATGGIVLVGAILAVVAIVDGRRSGLGWVVAGLAFGVSTSMLSQEYALYARATGHWHAVPVHWAALTGYLVLVATLLAAPAILLAERGRWRSRQWRYITPVVLALSLVSFILLAIEPGHLRTVADVGNPIGIEFFAGAKALGLWLGLPAVVVALLLGLEELKRHKPARSDEPAKPKQSEKRKEPKQSVEPEPEAESEPQEPDPVEGPRRPRRRAVAIVLVLWLSTVGAAALATVLAELAPEAAGSTPYPLVWILIGAGTMLAVATLGALAAVREPRRLGGWMTLTIGLGLSVAVLGNEYGSYALGRKESLAIPVDWAALVSDLVLTGILLCAPFLLLLAPEGRWHSRGWRRVIFPLLGVCAVSLTLIALSPGPLRTIPEVANPIGVDFFAGSDALALWVGLPVAACALLLALVALPRQRGEESEVSEEELAGLGEYERIKLRRRAFKTRKRRTFDFLKDFPRVLPYVRPYWWLGVTSLALLGVSVVVALIAPWPLAILLNTVIGSKPMPSVLGFLNGWSRTDLLVLAVVGGLVVTALESTVGVVHTYVDTRLSQSMELDVKSEMFNRVQSLSMAYHDKKKTGGMMYTINQQGGAIGDAAVAMPPLISAFVTLVAMFAISFKIDTQLALIALSVVPFIYFSTGYYTKRIEPRLYHVQNLEGQAMTIVYEAISMLRVIVSFGREKHEYRRFRNQAEEAAKARVGLTVRQTMFSLGVNMITALGTAMVLGVGAWHVLDKKLTPGELLVVMAYVAAVYMPLEEISRTFATLQQTFIAMQMAFVLLDTEPEIVDAPHAIEIESAEGHVTFEHVSFKHAGRRRRTLKKISFDASPGARVGIVGATGAGKTTLVNLIPRFYDPEIGRVLIDGIDVKDLALHSLRAQISIVHQSPLLFSGSIRENIRYGRLEASDEEIDEAAIAANAHDFISALPDGYETSLGEGGSLLSGGERQRISVARAFLRDAPILILDEPTASIDSHTEVVILEALDRLAAHRTTFTIAHRLSTLGRADLILVIDQGQLVEQGTHDELMANVHSLYRRTYEIQSRPSFRVLASESTPVAPAPPRYTDPSEALIDALRLLLDAPPGELDEISTSRSAPLEVRLAAGMLGVLSREDREKLRTLDDATLAEMLDEVRP